MTAPERPLPLISVVVPIHNEAGYLPHAVNRLLDELETVAARTEVILAENGSTDETARVARSLAQARPSLRLVQLAQADYGAAMRAGFLEAEGDWVVNFDIDYFSGAFLQQVLHIGAQADIVLASKRAPGAKDRRSRFRRLATRVFNLLLKTLFGSRVSDTHGMKAVRRQIIAAIVPSVESTLDLFDTELVLRAER
ncbi:MAG: glycosyltransferase family 2 protein, partial [Acidimicrobiia bacterium]